MSAILTISSWSRDPQVASCRNPAIRREWRALKAEERKDFTDTVNCLSREPARWGPNGTVYDGFSLLHERSGSLCMHLSLRVFAMSDTCTNSSSWICFILAMA